MRFPILIVVLVGLLSLLYIFTSGDETEAGLDRLGKREFKRLLEIANKEVRPDPEMVEYVKELTRLRAKEEGVRWSEKDFEKFIRKYVINAKLPVKPDGTVSFDPESPVLTFNLVELSWCKNSKECAKKIKEIHETMTTIYDKMAEGTATEKEKEIYWELSKQTYLARLNGDYTVLHSALKGCILDIKPENCDVVLLLDELENIVPALARMDLYPLYARLCFEQKLKDYCNIFTWLYLSYI